LLDVIVLVGDEVRVGIVFLVLVLYVLFDGDFLG